MEINGQFHIPTALRPGKDPPIPICVWDRMGLRAVLNALPKREVLPLIWNKTSVLLCTQSFYFECHTNKYIQKHVIDNKFPCA
jgi:hypothetical protein